MCKYYVEIKDTDILFPFDNYADAEKCFYYLKANAIHYDDRAMDLLFTLEDECSSYIVDYAVINTAENRKRLYK